MAIPKNLFAIARWTSASTDHLLKYINAEDGVASASPILPTTGINTASFIHSDSNGNFYYGYLQYLYKYNRAGVLQWTKTLTYTARFPCATTDNSGYVYAARTDSVNDIIKFDSDGVEEWTNDDVTSNTVCITVDSSGNVYTGHENGDIQKINSSGVQQWVNTTSFSNDVRHIKINSSGDVFAGGDDHLLKKINSSGTEIWSRSVDSLTVSGIEFGSTEEYLFVGCRGDGYIRYIKDEGSTSSVTWYQDFSNVGSYCQGIASDGVGGIYAHFSSGAIIRLDETEPSDDEDYLWINTDGYNFLDHITPDNLVVFSVGPFETDAELTGNGLPPSMSIGSFETATELTGIGANGLIYYYYSIVWDATNWTSNGIKKIYQSPHESWLIQGSEIYSGYSKTLFINEICADDSGHVYCASYSGSTYYLDCINSDGGNVWHRAMPVTTTSPRSITTDGTYLYVATNYISGKIYKFQCSDGTEITTGGFPVTDSIIDGDAFKRLIIGRDGYLYAAVNHSLNTYNGYVYKLDPSDGSEEWNYQLPQGGTGHSVNDIDVNADGYVAIGSVQLNQVGDSVHVLDSTGAVDNYFDITGLVVGIRIDASGYVYCRIDGGTFGLDFGKYDPNNADPESNPVWTKTNLGGGSGIGMLPDESAIYAVASTIGNDAFLFDTSDGTLLHQFPAYDNGVTSTPAMLDDPKPAWEIIITAGSNGTITNDLSAEFETGTYLFPAGEDVTFTFTGDTGYLINDVEVDSVSQGVIPSYTISAISGQHTITASFAQGFEIGSFQETAEITGSGVQQIPVGPFEETAEITGDGAITAISAGSFQETAELVGDGELIDTTGMVELYKFVLTGANDGLSDVEIPITSFQMRQYNTGLSYLNVNIHGVGYADEIDDRSNGTLELYLVYAEPSDLSEILRNRIVETAFDSVVVDEGSVNQSITLSGNETTAMKNERLANAKTVTLTDKWFNYYRTTNGSIRLRLSTPHRSLRAGDTVVCSAGTFVVDQITWTESVGNRTIEIAEAA